MLGACRCGDYKDSHIDGAVKAVNKGMSLFHSPPPQVLYLKPHTSGHGFSNYDTRTTTGMPAIVYCYAALIKNIAI